jgi:hypothetical protein
VFWGLLALIVVLALSPVVGAAPTNYNISVTTGMPTVESMMMSLLYANCTDQLGTSHNETVSFAIEGDAFNWVASRARYEAHPRRSIPQTVTYDTVTSFTDLNDPTATGVVNASTTVTWENNRLDDVIAPAVTGDLTGVLWGMTIYNVGSTLAYTFMVFALSIAVWNHSGPEPVLVLWLLMWGAWVSVVHGTAGEVGIVLLVLGGGTLTAKVFLDRRNLA